MCGLCTAVHLLQICSRAKIHLNDSTMQFMRQTSSDEDFDRKLDFWATSHGFSKKAAMRRGEKNFSTILALLMSVSLALLIISGRV